MFQLQMCEVLFILTLCLKDQFTKQCQATQCWFNINFILAYSVFLQYLIKVNEIKTKKGVDLLQHLVEYYQAQSK